MIQILLLPVRPSMAEAGLEYLALGWDLCRHSPDTSMGTQLPDLQLMILPLGINVGDCPSFHSWEYQSSSHHFLARTWQISLLTIEL